MQQCPFLHRTTYCVIKTKIECFLNCISISHLLCAMVKARKQNISITNVTDASDSICISVSVTSKLQIVRWSGGEQAFV